MHFKFSLKFKISNSKFPRNKLFINSKALRFDRNFKTSCNYYKSNLTLKVRL